MYDDSVYRHTDRGDSGQVTMDVKHKIWTASARRFRFRFRFRFRTPLPHAARRTPLPHAASARRFRGCQRIDRLP